LAHSAPSLGNKIFSYPDSRKLLITHTLLSCRMCFLVHKFRLFLTFNSGLNTETQVVCPPLFADYQTQLRMVPWRGPVTNPPTLIIVRPIIISRLDISQFLLYSTKLIIICSAELCNRSKPLLLAWKGAAGRHNYPVRRRIALCDCVWFKRRIPALWRVFSVLYSLRETPRRRALSTYSSKDDRLASLRSYDI
jgi:hypothetical protein